MQNKIVENGFRVIALRTLPQLKDGKPYYLKVLKPDTYYYFYNNYYIDPKTDKITQRDTLNAGLYNQPVHSKINISAIVGKNGSGKSSLIELIFRAINNIAARQKPPLADDLEFTNNLRIELFFQTDRLYKLLVDDSEVEVWKYDEFGNRDYEPETQFRFAEFFYTIAVNYSHFAYNIDDMEDSVDWLDGLFHKNDGYQTPLVISPLRKDGNIDINTENHLVKSRLIANLVRPVRSKKFSFRNLTEKLEATALRLSLNPSRQEKVIYKIKNDKEVEEEIKLKDIQTDRDTVLSALNEIYDFGFNDLNKTTYEIALDYIYYKLISIATKYKDYKKFFSVAKRAFYENLEDRTISDFLSALMKDDSHITFKLRQTLNFLKFKNLDLQTKFVPLDALARQITGLRRRYKMGAEEVIDMLPPPIFNIEIVMQTRDDKKQEVPPEQFSSGEKQLIYSVSSILYHLYNLNSIRRSKTRKAYNYVNIVLEEIELYFHPEMQRTYIKFILDSISHLPFRRIDGINICFVTHSPFILSDIPNTNILFLQEDGTPAKNYKRFRTFGGNIHDLLAHSFFLDKGFVGEFAKEKIQSVLNQLARGETKEIYTQEQVKSFIEMIGEPFLREKMMEMYYVKYAKQQRIKELRAELNRLENDQTRLQ